MTEEGAKPKSKRTYRKRRLVDDYEIIDMFFGFGLGLIVGAAHEMRCMQILGMPHGKKSCISGKYCPIHATQEVKQEGETKSEQ